MSDDPEDDRRRPPCPVCGEQFVPGMEWLQLNRWGICTGMARSFNTAKNEDGECIFDVSHDMDHEDIVTGPVLHWPVCATTYVEAQLAEMRVIAREKGWAK